MTRWRGCSPRGIMDFTCGRRNCYSVPGSWEPISDPESARDTRIERRLDSRPAPGTDRLNRDDRCGVRGLVEPEQQTAHSLVRVWPRARKLMTKCRSSTLAGPQVPSAVTKRGAALIGREHSHGVSTSAIRTHLAGVRTPPPASLCTPVRQLLCAGQQQHA